MTSESYKVRLAHMAHMHCHYSEERAVECIVTDNEQLIKM